MDFVWTTDIDSKIYADALLIRRRVFIDEQKVPEELEIDELEEVAEHVVLYVDSSPAGTARILKKNDEDWKVQRVAILKEYRNKKLGRSLMNAVEQRIQSHGAIRAVLDAQLHALPFYEKIGYTAEGEQFMDAGIPHKKMKKRLHQ